MRFVSGRVTQVVDSSDHQSLFFVTVKSVTQVFHDPNVEERSKHIDVPADVDLETAKINKIE